MGILSFFSSRLAVPVLGGIAALLFAIVLALVIQIHGWPWPFSGGGLKADIAALEHRINNPVDGYVVELDRANGRATAYRGGLETCNAGVDAAKAESEKRLAKAAEDLKRLQAERAAAAIRAGAILAARPLPGETACQTAARFLDEGNR